MRVLQITVHYHPNVGGVETHLSDLVKALTRRGCLVFVLAYRPLTTKVSWKWRQQDKNLKILRLPWLAGWFYKLEKHPIFAFLYLTPGLFLAAPLAIWLYKPEVIHGHGLVSGFIAVFWGKIFGKRVVLATHNIYSFPKKGLYRNFAGWIFKQADYSMGPSRQAAQEIKTLGVAAEKVGSFTYWLNLKKFQSLTPKAKIKKRLNWQNKFVVLFVGRLIQEKGVLELLEAVKIWNENITLVMAGLGPLESQVESSRLKIKNLIFLGKMANDELPDYYRAADLVIVPSIHEEGFGRVIIEALACGTPVIGSKKGAIPEAMNDTVGKLIEVNPKTIKQTVEYFYKRPEDLAKLARKTRAFAEKRYSEANVKTIIKAYQN